MKFLIQKIDGEVRHDFSFTLLESIRFKNWLLHNKADKINVKYINTKADIEIVDPNIFKSMHSTYVPIGSVEFVNAFLKRFYDLTLKPINVPVELFSYAKRDIFNGNQTSLENFGGKYFVKSNDKIKSFAEIIECRTDSVETTYSTPIPVGNYQFSQYINIDSEWRAFVYNKKLVGLQNYCGEFTKFPSVSKIKEMIDAYVSAPIAYSLDIGINDFGTFPIECHNMVSVGLYNFNDLNILTNMFYSAFKELISNKK